MDEYNYTIISLTSWKEYKDFVNDLSENWAYRGQANSNWVLNNAIERTDFIHFHKNIEAEFVAEFQRGARNYLSKDETPQHLIEWLALMQHHGAPTRLLDFSKSPFIAAFFAFEICQPIEEYKIAVWAINAKYFKTRAIEVLSEHYKEDFKEHRSFINEQVFEKIFFDNNKSMVFPVEPFRMNRRYSLQQSIFVSTGNGPEPFMQQLKFLGSHISHAVIKIELPAILKKEVLRDLLIMNLNRASLFPDLDGYASSLRLKYNSMKSPEETAIEQIDKMERHNRKFLP
jgi:hypothetical protein